jgi:hypothetical protein
MAPARQEAMVTAGNALTTYKFAVVLKRSLEAGPALNAAAHMTACLVDRADETTRAQMSFLDYQDRDGNCHPVSGLSLIVLSAKNSNQIRAARVAARKAEVLCVDFTQSMTGGTFVEQMERTSQFAESELDYWGLAFFGPKQTVDPLTRKFSLWR